MNKVVKKFAKFRTSWGFMGALGSFAGIWVLVNTWSLTEHFDPYPFILLNLILSLEAGLMMPLMVMMNNAHAEKDRKMLTEDLKLDHQTQKDLEQVKIKLDLILEKVK